MMPRPDPFLLSVVIPCYNEEAVIDLTHKTLLDALGNHAAFTLECLYVNDGSRDRTEEILAGFAAEDPRVRVVSLTRNFGHQPAVTAGLEHARGDAVAVIDADLQDPPAVILEMIDKWRQGYDIVCGVRTHRKEGFLKRSAYALFYRIFQRLSDFHVQVDSGDFALMDRKVVEVLNLLPEKNRFIRGLRAWTGYRQTEVRYERAGRAAGETKYPFNKLAKLATDGILNFSTAPLTLIFYLGIINAVLASLAFVLVLLHRIVDFKFLGFSPSDIPGYTSILLALLLFNGVQLISIGILGEYMGRIYQEVKLRPAYLVKKVIGDEDPTEEDKN